MTATSPSTPRIDKQQDDATGDAAELPARAGFDLAAMRAVIDGIEQGKGRHDLMRATRAEFAPPPPPGDMSAEPPQSTSLRITKSPDLTPTIEQQDSARHNPTRTAVSESTFAEPKSSRDIHDARSPESEEDASSSGPSGSPSLSDFPSRSHPTGNSVLSYDGVPWRAPVSTDKDAYGGGFGTPFGNPFHPTQFTAVGPTGSSPSNVSNPSPDAWPFQTYSGDVTNGTGAKKPSSVFAVNPWES